MADRKANFYYDILLFLCEVRCLSAFKVYKDQSAKSVNFIALGNTLVYVFKLLKREQNKDRVYTNQF